VFCGRTGELTKGHIWPDWIKKFLPPVARTHLQTVGEIGPTTSLGKGGLVLLRRTRQGHAGSRELRNTCSKCNSGWMSRLENAAMPIAGPLFQNRTSVIQTFDQRMLAAFLCLINMRVEFTNIATQAASAEDRQWLMKTFEPRNNWKIWIAHYAGKNPETDWCRHYGLDLVDSPINDGQPPKCNTQVTTIVIGHLCAHLFSSDFLPLEEYEQPALARIWPPTNFDINWGDVRYISVENIRVLAEVLPNSFPPISPTL
jgi:hypothetical protein